MSVSGVLIIDKPAGMTSHDVVQRVRRCFKTRKVGHAGTLDPDVTGVLVVCIEEATRLIEYATADNKVYEGTACFGKATDTDDATGNVIAEASAEHVTSAQIHEAASRFVGRTMQTVPKYSAVHVDGKRAYEYARAGLDVELPSREIDIGEFAVANFQPGFCAYADFRVKCSKGTYVRALCRDWGNVLGIPACMHDLRRTASGPFQIEEAVPLQVLMDSDSPEQYLLPLTAALRSMEQYRVSNEEAVRLAHGQTILFAATKPCNSDVAVLTEDGQLVCVASVDDSEFPRVRLSPRKVFWKRDTENAHH